MPESIQDWLISEGFCVDQDNGCFQKGANKVPFSDIIGHSLDSFKKNLKSKGWSAEEESPKTEDDPVPTPYGGWIIWPHTVDMSGFKP